MGAFGALDPSSNLGRAIIINKQSIITSSYLVLVVDNSISGKGHGAGPIISDNLITNRGNGPAEAMPIGTNGLNLFENNIVTFSVGGRYDSNRSKAHLTFL